MSDDNQSATTTPSAQQNAELPEWARRTIAEANAEAAKYRVKAQTAADEAKAETKAAYDKQLQALASEKTSISEERDKAVIESTKLKVTIAAQVPGEQAVQFANLLQGSTEDELKTHAETLKSMFNVKTSARATDPSQGLGGASGTKNASDIFADMVNSRLGK